MASWNRSLRLLATSFCAGAPSEDGLVDRAAQLYGRRPRWLRPLAREFLASFGDASRPPEAEVRAFLRANPRYRRAWNRGAARVAAGLLRAPVMWPARGAPESWPLPQFTGVKEAADWLGLDLSQLIWLCRYGGKDHYHYRWIPKRRGGWRLLESPKPLLKRTQRRILDALLHHIPVHEACHGFRPAGSVHAFLRPHTHREILLKIDLANFFPSVTAGRILRIFLSAGYPESVAAILTRLTTHGTPLSELPAHLHQEERQRLRIPHLPQGSPASPALANLSAFRLDCRLAGLAQHAGCAYTRYADDLLFSGEASFGSAIHRFHDTVSRIILEEGFAPNVRKTRIMRRSQRQRAAGAVLNEGLNIDRREWDRLKAILTNGLRHGLDSQNREQLPDFRAHLDGKISWVESLNPARGAKLRDLLRQIPG